MQIGDLIHQRVRERGPLTVAAFMELALYDAEVGYYARAAQRSGRAGDFFTSVDVGPLFGALLAAQIAEMAGLLSAPGPETSDLGAPGGGPSPEAWFDVVEAGAGNGRLAADILRAAGRRDPSLYRRIRLHLVEASAAAREAQPATLGEVVDRLTASSSTLPDSFDGVLVANELLDALPTHQVVMREDGLHEVYVDAGGRSLATREGPLSTPALGEYLVRAGVELQPGWRAEINLRAEEWVRDVSRRLRRGFLILIDYGHEARELYSAAHADGTLTTFARHTMAGSEGRTDAPPWLRHPGGQDITAHVDFTSVRAAAEAEGLDALGFLDQTYFLLGLLTGGLESLSVSDTLIAEIERNPGPLKTLLMPGGLGSTHKVLLLGKGVGPVALRGCSFGRRVT